MLDNQNLFSDHQAITASAPSTNFINLGTPNTPPGSPAPLKRDIGGGNNMPLSIIVEADFAGLTSLTVNIEVDDNSAFSSPKVVGSTGAIPVAQLKRGEALPLATVPPGVDEKYMRLNYVVGGVNATAGTISAGISGGVRTNG